MLYISSLENHLPLFQALSSDIRVDILKLILSNPGITIKQIAQHMNLSPSTLSLHINKLSEADLICIENTSAPRGTQRKCYCHISQLVLDFDKKTNLSPIYKAEIPVGEYSSFSVAPTCGLSTPTHFLGQLDEERTFAHPARKEAGVLWFGTGYIEYTLPNFIPVNHKICQLVLSFEIASEAPLFNNDWPSEITFSLNGTELGTWISPGDYGDRPGNLNPKWWYTFLNQYGLLKILRITSSGTYLDDDKISDVTPESLALAWNTILRFRLEVKADSRHPGGLTLYGKSFGDFAQDIKMSIRYGDTYD